MGDRHKAMVQQRLREGAKKAKDKEVADHDLRMTILAMEQSARASMGMGDGKRRREVPTATEEPEKVELQLQGSGKTAELLDPVKEELREQKRKVSIKKYINFGLKMKLNSVERIEEKIKAITTLD